MKALLTAHIEIPKGSDRRTYLSRDKSGYVDLGPIKDAIPINGGVMPIHYGFIIGTINKEEQSEWPEELDVLVYSDTSFKQGDLVTIEPIALMRREDKDDKIVATVIGEPEPAHWEGIPNAERELLTDYFGYKSKVIKIEGKEAALDLIKLSHA